MNKNVMACILAYYPENEFENICKVISCQTGLLLIVDNSPECVLKNQAIKFDDNVNVIYNKNKDAISGALNIALSYARDNNFEYLHIFDQDTIPPANITELLIPALLADPKTVISSPRFINSSTNFPGRVLKYLNKWRLKNIWPDRDIGMVKVLFTISTASLINLRRLPQGAFYDRRLFVDGCDVDFCLNLREAGLEIVVDTSVCVTHGIGARKKGGGRWSATNYSPFRKQLSSKNRMIIWRRYYKKFPGYIMSDLFVFFLDSGRTILLEKDRFIKFKAICKGIWQGVKEKEISRRLS